MLSKAVHLWSVTDLSSLHLLQSLPPRWTPMKHLMRLPKGSFHL